MWRRIVKSNGVKKTVRDSSFAGLLVRKQPSTFTSLQAWASGPLTIPYDCSNLVKYMRKYKDVNKRGSVSLVLILGESTPEIKLALPFLTFTYK
jgi:hypothetical protein